MVDEPPAEPINQPQARRKGLSVGDLFPPVVVGDDRYGEVRLGPLTSADSDFVAGLIRQELPAREVTVRVVHRQLHHPRLELEAVRAWPDDWLIRIAATWARNHGGFHTPPSQPLATFDDFVAAARRYADDLRKQIRNAMSSFSASWVNPMLDLSPLRLGVQAAADRYANAFGAIASSLSLGALQTTDQASRALMLSAQDLVGNMRLAVGGVLGADWQRSAGLTSIGIGSVFREASATFLPDLNIGRFIVDLPDLAATFEDLRRTQRRGKAMLDETGYGFAGHALLSTVFAYLEEIDPQVRAAVATRDFLAYTRSEDFEHALRASFEESIMLRRWWRIIDRALAAHRQRDYVLSIPPLLAQVEGAIADALILKGTVVPIGKKLYAKEPNGTIKRNRKGERIAIHGASELLKRSGFKDHAVLKGIAEVMTDKVLQERNSILHGRRTSYGTAKLSNQALLMLSILSAEFAAFEQGEDANEPPA